MRQLSTSPLRVASLLVALCITASAPAVGEELDAVVARAVRSNYEALHGCYRRVLAQDRRRHGTLFVRVVLGPGDSVAGAKVERDELKSVEHAACVLSWVRGWTLKGASAAGVEAGAEILLPLTFRAAPGQFVVTREDTSEISLGPGVTARVVLSPANTGARRASAVHLEVKGRLPLAGKAQVEQLLYVSRGKGQLVNSAARQRWPLAAGSYAWIPADARLELRGALSALQIFIPPGLEREYMAGRQPVTGAKVRWPVVGQGGRRRALRAPRGAPRFTPLLHPAGQSHSRFYMGLVEAPAGSAVPLNTHPEAAELIFILSGAGQAACGEVSAAVGPGDALYLPQGVAHKMTIKKRMRALQLYVPAGPEQRFLNQPQGKTSR